MSLSMEQQKSVLGFGPGTVAPIFGCLEGSGKLALWVGGGEPDAAEMSEEGLRETGGGRDGRGDGLEAGEEAKGLGEVSESMLVTAVGGQ